MNATCNICSKLFDSTKDVAAISCGHTFHWTCLDGWSKIQTTCPQCLMNFSVENVIPKLYFETSDEHATAADLQSQIKRLQKTLLVKEKEINEANKVSDDLRSQVTILQIQCSHLAAEFHAQQKPMLQSKLQLNDQEICEMQKIEISILCNKLTELKNFEKIVKGSESEMEEVLRTCRMNYSVVNQPLLAYCSVLKKELQQTTEQKKQEAETATRRTSDLHSRLRQHEFALAELQADLKHSGEGQNDTVRKKVTALQASFNSLIRHFSNAPDEV